MKGDAGEDGLGFAAAGDDATGYGAILLARTSTPRPLRVGNSAALTAGLIIADVVGAGILSMGVAVAKFGWLLGTFVIIAMLAVQIHTSLVLWRVRMGFPNAFTYTDLATAAFAKAPDWQRKLVQTTTLGCQQIFLFLVLSLYSLTIGRGLGTLFYDELRLCLPVLVLLGLAVFLPLQLSVRSMGQYQSVIVLNLLTIIGSVVIPLVHMSFSGIEGTRLPGSHMLAVEELSVVGVLSGLKVMNFAFISQFMLVEIMAEMSDAEEFPKAYMISAPFQGIMFVIAGVGAYYFAGSKVTGIMGENLPFGPTFRMSAACLLVHMLITFLIKGVVFCRWVHQVWDPAGVNDTSARGWVGWASTVSACTALCWLMAQIVPFFSDFMDLLGASLAPVSCTLLPIGLYLRWLKDTGGKGRAVGPLEACAFVLEVMLSVVLMTFGTYFAVKTIGANWRTYGMPFDCHCHNIWSTCECSQHHAGMEHCLQGKA